MSDTHSQSFQRYWSWIDNLSPIVRKVVLACWDQTGRPISEPYKPILMLLDQCATYDQFYDLFMEVMSDPGNVGSEEDAELYWNLYFGGIERAKNDLIKS